MDNSEIKQQMVDREHFAPDADEVRAAVVAGRAASNALSAERRRNRLLAGVAAGIVILIVGAVGLVRAWQPQQRVSSPLPAPSSSSASILAPPAWVGVDWTLVTVAQGGPGIDVPEETGLLLQFQRNGAISGGGRCYNLTGRWTVVGEALGVSPVVAQQHHCAASLDSATAESIRNSKLVRSATQSLATVGATGGHIDGKNLIMQSGPYELTYRNVGRTAIPPSSTDLSSSPGSTAVGGASPVLSPQSSTAATGNLAPAARQRIVGATVYDPMADGVKDNPDQASSAFDGDPSTFWHTFLYQQQFPSDLKPGVGLTVQFAGPITPTAVRIFSDTPGTVVEIRSATAPDVPYSQTTALGRVTIPAQTAAVPGEVTIPLTDAPRSRYLVLFVVHLSADGANLSSDINEIAVLGS